MSEQSGKPKDDLIGRKLGQYEIIEEIGRGGMATVYRARQLSISRIVAVKVLPRHLLHDPGFYERFEREVDVIAHLEHPHILPIYDYGSAEEVPYIAMRFLGGGSMAQLIRRGQTRIRELERPFTQVAQALDHAHRQGIIHRDLKPGNIMLDENGNAYLSDFGIARVLGSNLTGSQIIGTPAYMSPEQANGLPLDARSDIYSLGVVLFELITGREPYQAETPLALLLKHINEPIPPIANFRNDVPAAVEEVVRKATAKDPNDRYSSASEMAREFSLALHQPVSPRPGAGSLEETPTLLKEPGGQQRAEVYPATVQPGTLPAAATQNPIQQTASVTPRPKRSPLPLILGGVILLIAVVAGVAVAPSVLNPTPAITLIPATVGPPTPFRNSQVVREADYTLYVPEDWTLTDFSEGEIEVGHMWTADDDSAFIRLILNRPRVTTDAGFQTAIDRFANTYVIDEFRLDFIDDQTFPDGTLRRSYRADNDPNLEPGQMDVFYIRRLPFLVVLQFYSADMNGDDLVDTFQNVLDSLRVNTQSG